MKHDSGRSMVEMIMVIALIGVLTLGSLYAYQTARNKSEANRIQELVSTASLNALTKMKNLPNSGEHNVWKVTGKEEEDYPCVDSLQASTDGNVSIQFTADCDDIKKLLVTQWGDQVSGNNPYTYTPRSYDMQGL